MRRRSSYLSNYSSNFASKSGLVVKKEGESHLDWVNYDPFKERDEHASERRSRRKRVLPVMHWLGLEVVLFVVILNFFVGEKPLYERRKPTDIVPVVKKYGYDGGRKGPPSPTPKRGRKPRKK